MAITPTQTQIERLTADSGAESPVVMLNLLRFKERADGIDEGASGREAYQRYAEATAPFLARVGGRVLLAVDTEQTVIGPELPEWGMALTVEYSSRQQFLAVAMAPACVQVHEHRAAALSDSRLIACSPIAVPSTPDPNRSGGS